MLKINELVAIGENSAVKTRRKLSFCESVSLSATQKDLVFRNG